ncbi:MAG TPA: hypothetical protein VFU46_09545 [Gemmatimonadales bacterium]|nr:hypothetical protein [Gemmatimonadales bacterium]
MTITVQVAPELARALRHRGPPSAQTAELERIATELGVSFRPLHPDTDDVTLSSYLVVDVSDPDLAERVMARLRQSPAIKAAYVKPPEAMA